MENLLTFLSGSLCGVSQYRFINDATQAGKAPPRFVIFASHPEAINPSYHRFLLNRLRDEFGFAGATVRLEVRKSE